MLRVYEAVAKNLRHLSRSPQQPVGRIPDRMLLAATDPWGQRTEDVAGDVQSYNRKEVNLEL